MMQEEEEENIIISLYTRVKQTDSRTILFSENSLISCSFLSGKFYERFSIVLFLFGAQAQGNLF